MQNLRHQSALISLIKKFSELTFELLPTGCAKINYSLSTGHDKSYDGPVLTIYQLIFSKDSRLDANIFMFFSPPFIEL